MFANLSIHALGHGADLVQTIPLAAESGFEGIDLPLEEVATMDRPEEANEWVRAAGLRWGGFGLPTEFRSGQAVYDKGMEQLARWAPTARRADCNRCYLWISPGHNEMDFKTQFDFYVRRLGPIAALLADHGVRLGLEFIGPRTLRETYRHPFIHTIEGMLELCDAVSAGRGGVGLLLDSFHWWTSGATAADLLELLNNEKIVYVHVNDGRAGRSRDEQMDLERDLPCATGLIDATTFVSSLRRLEYDGPVTAEPFLPELDDLPADEAVKRTADSVRKMLSLG